MPLPSFSRGSSPIKPNRLSELKKGSVSNKFKSNGSGFRDIEKSKQKEFLKKKFGIK